MPAMATHVENALTATELITHLKTVRVLNFMLRIFTRVKNDCKTKGEKVDAAFLFLLLTI